MDGKNSASERYDFFKWKEQGGCVRFTGNVLVLFVLVDEPESIWTTNDINSYRINQEDDLRELIAQAKEYGAQLSIKTAFIRSRIAEKLTVENQYSMVRAALACTEFPDDNTAIQRAKLTYGADEVAFVFAINRRGRSFAVSKTQKYKNKFEYAVVYAGANDGTINHELLHLFGARDLYYPEEFRQAAEKHFGESTMLSSDDDVDDLTAYVIGWTNRLSKSANDFLEDMSHISETYVCRANSNQWITGKAQRNFYNSVYNGELVEGQLHGKGVMTWKDGTVYDGEWKNGQKDGYGIMTWPSGDKYVGYWVKNCKHGRGLYTYANGAFYDGEWKNDKRDGYGTIAWSSGDKYVGNWSQGVFHGRGKYTFADGSCYDGEWKNDKREGYGTMVWSSGSRYVGYWAQNEIDGKGVYTRSDGRVYSGTFKNGTFCG